jgi:ABC-type dipeptide/oligopeptide/nickel transport system permease component
MTALARKLAVYAITAWVAITVNFLLPHLMPGNPVQTMIGKLQGRVTPQTQKAIELQFGIGLHQSLWSQYTSYWSELFHGNLGQSITLSAPVSTVLGQTLPWTVGLLGAATVISFALGTLAGIALGWRRGSWLDGLLPVSTFFQAVPYFFLGTVLLLVLGSDLHWFPVLGNYARGMTPGFNLPFIGSVLRYAELPAATIVLSSIAGWMLGMRNMMITVMDTVQIPYYSGNTAATTALAAGQLDWAGNEIPDLQSLYVSKDPAHNHYWFPGGNTVTLWVNVAKGGPLADPKVRQAISAGLNPQELSSKGEYGYEAPATSSSGLILPVQQSFLAPSLANDISATPSASKVGSLLSADGYSKDSKGMWARNGQEISFSVEDPTAFTDYYADAQLIVGQLKSVGINATVDGVAAPAWFTDAADGNFQTMVHWGGGVGGAADPFPFGQYQYWMDSSIGAPMGQSATSNYGRYSNSQAQAAITAFENTNDTAAQATQLQKLESIESTEMPTIPLVYGADWNEYSTARITRWPTQSDPYMDPSPGARG